MYLARLEAAGRVQRLVAMKFLRDVDPQGAANLLREARLTALLTHPNIVQVVDAGADGDRPWFAMEFVPGLSLADLLEVASGRLPPWVAGRIAADLALGVHALHEAKDERGVALEIVHRDLSPHNVLVSWDGVVKLLDLGIARSQLQATTTQTGMIRGKLAYMSPEQAAGEAVDRRSDVFALGALLWEALAGRRLFFGDTEGELLARVIRGDIVPLTTAAPHAPLPLAEVAHRALSKRPADRFSTSLEMHRALEVAIRASGVIVGAHEVAHSLAMIVPERVREHEAWLREADSSSAGGAAAAKVGTLAVSVTRDPEGGSAERSGNKLRRFQTAAVVIGSLGVASVLGFGGTRFGRGAGHERAADAASSVPPPGPATATIQAPLEDGTGNPGASATAPVFAPVPAAGSSRPALAITSTPPSQPRHPVQSSTPVPASALASPGTLNVVSSPSWATVLLDGKVVGQTPIVLSGVVAGTHSIEGRALGVGSPEIRTVTVQSDAVTRVELGGER